MCSALEGLLLKNASEPLQQNVAERLAFLATNTVSERIELVNDFKELYKIRSEYIHHRQTSFSSRKIDVLFYRINIALINIISSVSKFKTKEQFINDLERRKFGG